MCHPQDVKFKKIVGLNCKTLQDAFSWWIWWHVVNFSIVQSLLHCDSILKWLTRLCFSCSYCTHVNNVNPAWTINVSVAKCIIEGYKKDDVQKGFLIMTSILSTFCIFRQTWYAYFWPSINNLKEAKTLLLPVFESFFLLRLYISTSLLS